MALNDLIAQGAQFQAPNMLQQFGQLQQLQQGQQANQLGQMKMTEMQRSLQEQEGVRNYLKQTPDFNPMNPVHQAGLMQVAPATAPKLLESFLTAKKTGVDIGKTQMETNAGDFKLRVDKADKAINDIGALATPEEAIASIDRHMTAGDLNPQQATTMKQQIASTPDFKTWQLNTQLGIMNAKDKLTMTAPKPTEVRLGDTVKTIDTNPYSPTYKQEVVKAMPIAQSADSRAQVAATYAGQASTAKTAANALAASTDPVIQGNLAGARATGETVAKNKVAAQAVLPQVVADAAQGIKEIDDLLGSAKTDSKTGKVTFEKGGAEPAKGFNAVGNIMTPLLKWVPGTDTATFTARHDQIMGSAFLKAYETLRGGGSITEQEGSKGTAAISRMSMAQSQGEYVTAARELQGIMKKGVERAQAKAGVVVNPHAAKTDAQIKAELGI